MNFFWEKNEFEVWANKNGFDDDENIYCLDIHEAFEASRKIFSK